MPITLALGRLRLEDREFEASLRYITRKKKKRVAVPEQLLVLGTRVNVCERNPKSNALARISRPVELSGSLPITFSQNLWRGELRQPVWGIPRSTLPSSTEFS